MSKNNNEKSDSIDLNKENLVKDSVERRLERYSIWLEPISMYKYEIGQIKAQFEKEISDLEDRNDKFIVQLKLEVDRRLSEATSIQKNPQSINVRTGEINSHIHVQTRTICSEGKVWEIKGWRQWI